MNWSEMTSAQQAQTNRAMAQFGGSFVDALARAWRLADATNGPRLMEAFPEIVSKYGPDGDLYRHVTTKEPATK